MKPIRLHRSIERELKELDVATRVRIAELFNLLSEGETLGMPVSRPMPSVAHGVHELRVKDRSGQYRLFYFLKHKEAIRCFTSLRKKRKKHQKMKLMSRKSD